MIKYTEDFIKFWSLYPNDLAMGKPGSKFKAFQAWDKYSLEEQQRIMFDTQALIRHDRNDPKPDRWPHASTYLNQQYFSRPIESQEQKREQREVSDCDICGQPSAFNRFNRCQACYAMENDRWAEQRKQIGQQVIPRSSGESKSEYIERVRKTLLQSLKSGKLQLTHNLLSEI